jgi:hypothetical protein
MYAHFQHSPNQNIYHLLPPVEILKFTNEDNQAF